MLYLYKPITCFLNSNFLYTSYEYNKGPIITNKELPVQTLWYYYFKYTVYIIYILYRE